MTDTRQPITYQIGISIPSLTGLICDCGDEGEGNPECIARQQADWERVKNSLEAQGYTILSGNDPDLYMRVEDEYDYLLDNARFGHFDRQEEDYYED